ncbi:MAG: hypothetical protein QOF28_2473, partial [Actinomycetota bacterium]|nr:hypothetical protein [Actinomycetota bacterium]
QHFDSVRAAVDELVDRETRAFDNTAKTHRVPRRRHHEPQPIADGEVTMPVGQPDRESVSGLTSRDIGELSLRGVHGSYPDPDGV